MHSALKIASTLSVLLLFQNCSQPKVESKAKPLEDKTAAIKIRPQDAPAEISLTAFAGPNIVPSPACIATSAYGDVYVGVDEMGSLGKEPNKGHIIKLIDSNKDGKADLYANYADVNNPRGLIAVGDKLYVLHTIFSKETHEAIRMDLVVFEDKDHDDVADGPPVTLIKSICTNTELASRGTDHATNGIQLGIDGWIYIAVGDYGFYNATDRSGKVLTMLGGGIVRIRPDGTNMEVYTHGMRNIYDIAIDPFMNIFTRGNTNDGGGWNIRFSHHIQSGEYGYPMLFKHFTNEIIPALADLGGGSGTGAYYMDDYRWPEKYNNVPMMADWGQSELFIHRVTPDKASFKQTEEKFIFLSQITDLDCDASGRMYLSAWDDAGFSGDPNKGFVATAVPKNWTYKPFADLKTLSVDALVNLLKEDSSPVRIYTQQELLTRSKSAVSKAVWKLVTDTQLPLKNRIAALYTYAQVNPSDAIKNIITLTKDNALKEFALRALSDNKALAKDVPVQLFVDALNDPSDRVKAAAIIGLGRLGNITTAKNLLTIPVPDSFVAPAYGTEGPHATPNSSIILPHLAVKSLVELGATNACLEAIKSPQYKLALWALKYTYTNRAVDGLIENYYQTNNEDIKQIIISTLCRLYKKETPFKGTTWWNTRPDTHGPIYNGETWEASPKIEQFLINIWQSSSPEVQNWFKQLNEKYRLNLVIFNDNHVVSEVEKENLMDLEKIKNLKGQVGKTSPENVTIAISKLEGNPALGEKLFTQQGCVTCHSIKQGEPLKGPYMGQIGSIMNKEQIAQSILQPNASISQGFATVMITTKDDSVFVGFVTSSTADKIELRNITGQKFTINTKDIKSQEELKNSMMPEGLANGLSFEEFASLVTFLSQQKK